MLEPAMFYMYQQIGVKKFTCDLGDKSFYRLDGLQKHVKSLY